jgi:hypothetical protein
MRSLRIFLCHSSSDKPKVRALYNRLLADGMTPWLDEKDLLPGQDWQEEIAKAVRQSDVVIVCISKGTINKRGFVQKEIRYALDVADEHPEDIVFLIPLRFEECEVPNRLSRWQWVDLFRDEGYERLMCSLKIRAGHLLIESKEQIIPTALGRTSLFTLRDELEAVDFYIDQGYIEIARENLDMLSKQYEGNAEIISRYERLDVK